MKSILDPSFSSMMLMHTDAQGAFDRLMRARQQTGALNTGAIAARSAVEFREQKLGTAGVRAVPISNHHRTMKK